MYKSTLFACALAVAGFGCRGERPRREPQPFSRTVETTASTAHDASRVTHGAGAGANDVDTHADENTDTSGTTGGATQSSGLSTTASGNGTTTNTGTNTENAGQGNTDDPTH